LIPLLHPVSIKQWLKLIASSTFNDGAWHIYRRKKRSLVFRRRASCEEINKKTKRVIDISKVFILRYRVVTIIEKKIIFYTLEIVADSIFLLLFLCPFFLIMDSNRRLPREIEHVIIDVLLLGGTSDDDDDFVGAPTAADVISTARLVCHYW
jgi:hypothetical protein